MPVPNAQRQVGGISLIMGPIECARYVAIIYGLDAVDWRDLHGFEGDDT